MHPYNKYVLGSVLICISIIDREKFSHIKTKQLFKNKKFLLFILKAISYLMLRVVSDGCLFVLKYLRLPIKWELSRKTFVLRDKISKSLKLTEVSEFKGELLTCRDTNLVWDSGTQSGTGHKSGTSNVYPLSNITKR